MPYVLEVVRWIDDHEEWIANGGEHESIGYLQNQFQTKQEAADYYDAHHPTMRRLNAHNTWTSDPDPDTRFAYIVIDASFAHAGPTIEPFVPK